MGKGAGIQLNGDYDLAISVRRDAMGKIISGLTIGNVVHQTQALLLLAHKGEFKEHPTAGVGINDVVGDNDFNLWKREITAQLEADGQRITRLSIDEKGLILDANYN
jgi:sulfopyruvate decarboxylase TPP-binding subunit